MKKKAALAALAVDGDGGEDEAEPSSRKLRKRATKVVEGLCYQLSVLNASLTCVNRYVYIVLDYDPPSKRRRNDVVEAESNDTGDDEAQVDEPEPSSKKAKGKGKGAYNFTL